MHIRDERPEDATFITAITDAAFAPRVHDEATLAKIAEMQRAAGISDQMLADAAGGLSESEVIVCLRNDRALLLSLVGEANGEVVAHIAFSAVTIGEFAHGWCQLGPVSVRPDQQGNGLGSALIREGLARLKALGAEGCVLLGWPHYYARFGFVQDTNLTFYGRTNPALQRLLFGGTVPEGDVVFHRAFDTG